MRTLSILAPWVVAHEALSSEHLVIITNFLVVIASFVLTAATVHAARNERTDERKWTLSIIKAIVKSGDGHHRKDS